MAGRLEFKEKLGDILKEAVAQRGEMQKEEVEKFFSEDGLSEEQIDLVCDYLLSQKGLWLSEEVGRSENGGRADKTQYRRTGISRGIPQKYRRDTEENGKRTDGREDGLLSSEDRG